jgi:hypothetical protein
MVQFDQLFMVLGVLVFSYMLVDFLVKFDYRIHRRKRSKRAYR